MMLVFPKYAHALLLRQMEHHLDLPLKHSDLVGSLALSSISAQKSTSHFPQSALGALTYSFM